MLQKTIIRKQIHVANITYITVKADGVTVVLDDDKTNLKFG